MPYILIARSPSGLLKVMADSAFASRDDALPALAVLASDPSYSEWDSEILLVDISDATPVLVVRPAPAPPSSETADAGSDVSDENVREGTGVADAWLADVDTAFPTAPSVADSLIEAMAAEPVAAGYDTDAVGQASAADAIAQMPPIGAEVGVAPYLPIAAKVEAPPDSHHVEGPFDEPVEPSSRVAAEPVPWPWDAPATELDPPDAHDLPVAPSMGVSAVETAAASSSDDHLASPTATGSERFEPVGSDFGEPTSPSDGGPPTLGEAASDFILDLDELPLSPPIPDEVLWITASDSDEQRLTSIENCLCSDCADAIACPTKNERLPKDCPSFRRR